MTYHACPALPREPKLAVHAEDRLACLAEPSHAPPGHVSPRRDWTLHDRPSLPYAALLVCSIAWKIAASSERF
jgi:hypothetical protein